MNVGLEGASGGEGGPVIVNNSGMITTAASMPTASRRPAWSPRRNTGFCPERGWRVRQWRGRLQPDSRNYRRRHEVGFSADVGGQGGGGNVGRAVAVSNTGVVVTNDTDSYGVYAQSIGGGGGNGGGAAAAPAFSTTSPVR